MTATRPPADTLTSLYRGYHDWLLVWLRRRLECPHNAADMAQDTFVRLLGMQTYIPPQEPRAFLATIANRLLIDRKRRDRLEQAYKEALLLYVEHMEQVPSTEQMHTALRTLEAVARALAGLRANVREAFLLRQFEGLSHAVIAQRLGVSTKSVQKYLVSALLALHAAADDATW